jgi:hypothetical protein
MSRKQHTPDICQAVCSGIILPACFLDSRNLALISKFTEADPANSIVAEISVWSAADLAAVIAACRELRLSLLL